MNAKTDKSAITISPEFQLGSVAERLNAPVLKTGEGVSPP